MTANCVIVSLSYWRTTLFSGFPCVWQSSGGCEEPRCSSLPVFSDCEEALGSCWSSRDRVVPCRDASDSAVLIQTPADHIHQVTYFPACIPSATVRRPSVAYFNVCCRPLTLSTEEYGTMWLAFSHDTKQNLTLISDDPEPLTATLSVLKRKLQLHVVEIIGKKMIIDLE